MPRFIRSAFFTATVTVTCFMLQIATLAVSPDAVAYRTNPAHTGQATMPDFPTTPVVKWDVKLQGMASCPVIAGGQVFVVTKGDRFELYALNATDGSIHWGPVIVPFGGAPTYENGRVFIGIGRQGIAFDAATGAVVWSTISPGLFFWSSYSQTALNGIIYSQNGGFVSAVRESDGTVLWSAPQIETSNGDLAATTNGLYISGACGQTYGLDPGTGNILWHLSTYCEGGGGFTAAYYNGAVYIQDYYNGSNPPSEAAINASTGQLINTFSNQGPPAFDNGLMFGIENYAVIATNLSNWSNVWTGNNGIDLPVTAPTVVNGTVYVGTSTGYLKGYDENTGTVNTMLNLGETPSYTGDASFDMGAGDGLLIVPAGNHLVAVGSASGSTLPPPPAGLQATPGNAQVALSWTASSGAVTYNVYRSTAPGGEGVVPVTTGVSSNNYTAIGLTNGTTYYFEVTEVNGGIESGKSNEASVMPMILTTMNSSDAVTYRSNPAHTGQATMPGFGASPAVSWDVNLPGTVSYPLIAGGRVFVLTTPTGNNPRALYALNAATGATIWGPVALPSGDFSFSGAALAYENGKVYITKNQPTIEEGLMVAYDAATGALDWSTTYQGQWWSADGPTALNGYVYTQEFGEVSCVRESDGTVMWTTGCEAASGDLAVTATGIYVTGACGQTDRLDPATGSRLWHLSTGCSGGGGYTAMYYYGKVYVNDYYSSSGPNNQLAAVDSATGLLVTAYTSEGPLAFDNGLMFGVVNNSVVATNVSNGINAWTSSGGADHLVTAPTVVNGIVYFGTVGGYLKGYDENTGAITTTLHLGEAPSPTQDAMVDMAAGDDMIVVPAGTHLVAVVAGPLNTPTAPTSLTATPSNRQVALSWTASSGATSYNVSRSTVSGSGYAIVASSVATNHANPGLTNGTTYYFVVSAVNGAGTSANSNQASATPFTTASVSIDFNGDGKTDLVLQDEATNRVAVWFMNGANVVGGNYVSMTPAPGWKVVGEGDFNGDGKPDLVLQNTALGKAAIWYLNGTTLVAGQYASLALPTGWTIVGVGDFNGDGKPDLVLQNVMSNQVAFWYMNGATVTGSAYASVTAAGWRVAGTGDFNGDGKTDLVLQNATSNAVAVWYMNGATVLNGQYISAPPSSGWQVAGIGDFNGDGAPDLVLQNVTSNKVALWYMNGLSVLGGAYTSTTPPAGWHAVGPR